MTGIGGNDKVSNNCRRFLRFGRNDRRGGLMTGVGYQDDRRGDFYRRDDYYEFAKVLEL